MRKASLFLILFLASSLSACNRPTTLSLTGLATGPKAWIDAPLDGSELPLAPYEIVFHVSDSDGMRAVQLVANGDVLHTSDRGGESGINTFRQRWNPPGPGEYELRARVQNRDGQWSPDAVAEVVVVVPALESDAVETGSAAITPTPAATPTFTPTPTPGPSSEDEEPTAELTRNAHCRYGPSGDYAIMTSALSGWIVPLEGQPEARHSGWWYVLLPEYGVRCWIGESSLDIRGETSSLPIILAPTLATPTPTTPPIPAAPSNVHKASLTCGPLSLTLAWNDNSNNETGFRVFRNNVLIAIVPANSTSYTDNTIGLGADYTFAVEAFNDYGSSARASQFIVGCAPLY
ncbi:MAG: hypothetical protein JXA97_11285 [Anaerolineales bacterium]|nr:hypothetical protein [Anaerolineales bacterium]